MPTPAQMRQRRLDALIKAIDWSHVIAWQIERLHQAEQQAWSSEQARRGDAEYRQEHRMPFSRLRAEAYFLLGAVRQLVRAMDVYGERKKVPSFTHGTQVLVAVRNAAEHWDSDTASGKLTKHTGASWSDYRFGAGGTVIAGVIKVDEVAEWAREVQNHLLDAERNWR